MHVKVNGRINAAVVRVIAEDDLDLGVHPLSEALEMARAGGLDLVEIGPHESPPTCRLIDYGRFRFQMAQQGKDRSR